MKRLWLIGVLLMLGLASNAYSQPVNYGFEAGGTSGWTETYPALDDARIDVVTGWTGPGGASYSPVEGNYFAALDTGSPDGDYTTLSQRFSLNREETLEGWAAFCCGSEVYFPYPSKDSMDFNDYALISVLNGYGNVVAVPWYADSYDISYYITTPAGDVTGQVNFGPVPWEHWSWTAPAPDVYTLQYRVTNGGDAAGDSFAFFDGSGGATAVPEPSVMALLGIGLAGIMAMRIFGKARTRMSARPA